jgi:hypothetical protein
LKKFLSETHDTDLWIAYQMVKYSTKHAKCWKSNLTAKSLVQYRRYPQHSGVQWCHPIQVHESINKGWKDTISYSWV